MIINDFFSPKQDATSNTFDDCERKQHHQDERVATINTSSINTSAYDAYRQGVEITSNKHFDAGVVKIHAGEPHHVSLKTAHGLERYRETNKSVFADVQHFVPQVYIAEQANGATSTSFKQPFLMRDFDQLDERFLNGTIEPFPHRETNSARGVKAEFDGGPGSRAISSVDYRDVVLDDSESFVDHASSFGNVVISRATYTAPNVTTPFVEQAMSRNVPLSTHVNYDADLLSAVSAFGNSSLSGSSVLGDAYVRYNEIASATGWTYDVYPDTLAFGGLKQ